MCGQGADVSPILRTVEWTGAQRSQDLGETSDDDNDRAHVSSLALMDACAPRVGLKLAADAVHALGCRAHPMFECTYALVSPSNDLMRRLLNQ